MKVVISFSLFFFLLTRAIYLAGQVKPIGLRDEQRDRLVAIQSSEKKLSRYKKYIHKDSLRYARDLNRYWQKKSDSIDEAIEKRNSFIQENQNRISGKFNGFARRGKEMLAIQEELYKFPPELNIIYSDKQIDFFYSSARYFLIEVSKDTMQMFPGVLRDVFSEPELDLRNHINIRRTSNVDNPLQIADKGNLIDNNRALTRIDGLKGKASEYSSDYKENREYANLTTDSIRHLAASRGEEELRDKALPVNGDYMKQVNDFKILQKTYKAQLDGLQDTVKQKEVARQRAEELVMEYIESNPTVLKNAQRRMILLMRKYSFVSNSNDLSTAVRRTSLEGNPFRERLVIATNFQLLSIEPVSLDFSPQVGYKINSRFVLGIGGAYRQTFSDSLATFSPEVFGYKVFSSYDIIRSFFGYVEYDRNSPGVEIKEGISRRIWKPAFLLGIGRKFSIHRKVDMTVVALYNLLYQQGDPIYPRPFMVRVGFQLSEIALLKRRPEIRY